jgi:hypothetical protein
MTGGDLMTGTIQSEHFTAALLTLLDETFGHVQGYFLDRNTSLFETLAGISAEEASIPVGGKCATLAAQVKHTAFYLDVACNSLLDPDYPNADWGEIWRTVGAVTTEEWAAIQSELRLSYKRVLELIHQTPVWSGEDQIAAIMAVIVHSAYHLGEIRQALCTIQA